MNRIGPLLGLLCFTLALHAADPSPSPAAGDIAAEPLPRLKVSANGHFLVEDNGKPFFYLADTAWGLFSHANPDDVDVYLSDRAVKGFTVIQAVVALWDASRHPDYNGDLPFVGNDATKPNDAYFKNVDNVIDKAQAKGLRVALVPFWFKGMKTNIPALLDPPTAQAFCQYLGARYRDKPVIWILGGDTAGKTPTGPDYMPLVRAMAAGLHAGDGGAHLITYHPTGRQSSSFWFHNEPWLDFNLLQSGHFIQNTNYDLIAADYAKTPAKPVIDGESGYENITDRLLSAKINPDAKRIQAQDVRRFAYLSLFAGAAGHTYGNGEVYGFWTPAAGNSPRWGSGLPWRQSLELPGSSQMQFIRNLIESRPMLTRIPDQTMIIGDASSTTNRFQATRASDGSYAFIYTAAGQPVQAELKNLAGGRIRATWFDPRTGASQLIGIIPRTDSHTFTPPGSGDGKDWVLVLDNAALNFSPPGLSRSPEN